MKMIIATALAAGLAAAPWPKRLAPLIMPSAPSK